MKLMISGASGFIGNSLLNLLAKEKFIEVVTIGRSKSSLHSIKHYNKNITYDENYIGALDGVNCVIHCAGVASRRGVNLDEVNDVNIKGTVNLAKQAAIAGVKRFIFLSSIKVNGESTSGKIPFKADDKTAAKDPYGISKAEAEQQLLKLSRQTNMEIVIIRPPLVYGEGVKANFASLMSFIDKGLPLPFRAIKNNKRSLVSVYNLVDLIKVCIVHPNAAHQTFLVSDDNDLSTSEMVALMAKVQNKKNLAFPVPVCLFKLAGRLLNNKDVVDRLIGSLQLDITHTKNTLGWQPPYSVEHGFKLAAKKPS